VDQITEEHKNNFNFDLEAIDMFKFQDIDYREEKKKVQEELKEQQAEQAKRLATMPLTGRNKRMVNLQMVEDDVHKAKLKKDKRSQDEADYTDSDSEEGKPKKDKSISMSKIHEF
jgi:hypothetical protein